MKIISLLSLLRLTGALLLGISLTAHATLYTGVTTNGKNAVRVSANTATSTAATNWANAVTVLGTETFDNAFTGTLNFGSITASISGSNSGLSSVSSSTATNHNGTYPTTGNSFWFNQNNTTTITFSAKIAAVSLYLTDVSDMGSVLTLSLYSGSALVNTYTITPTTTGSILDGSLIFVGLTSTTSFDKIVFSNSKSGDGYGIDTISIGTLATSESPVVTAVPEPSTYGLMGAASLLGFAAYRRRKAAKK